MSWTKVIAITGCDSGLGWALAARTAREGFITIAGMHQGTETKAAKALEELCVHPCPLDVTKPDSVAGFHGYIKRLLDDNPRYKLYAVVNNAGIMTIGDFEWLTPNMIENTMNVNLLGAMRVMTAFLPDLRTTALQSQINPRVINVASHCGIQPLPGFASYSASKAGLLALTEAVRLEQQRHGLYAVSFIPGGFIGYSNLLHNHVTHAKKMISGLNDEQKGFYGKRIKTLSDYFEPITGIVDYDALKDEAIIETFMKALQDSKPKEVYKVEPLRYKLYFSLLRMPLPEFVRSWIVKKFINFPQE